MLEKPKNSLFLSSDSKLSQKEIEELLGSGGGRKKGGKNSKRQEKISECELAITSIFLRNKASKAKIIVNRGGARSGKSYSIAQLIFERFFTLPRRKILILRKTLPSLRISTLDLMQKLLDKMGLRFCVKEEKNALNFWFPVLSSQIHYGSLDQMDKVKSSEWNDIWMEEANEFSYDDFQVLKTRLSFPVNPGYRNQLFMSLNPIDESHWIKRKVVDGAEDVDEIVSSYKDNPFLDKDYRKILEDLVNQDANHYRVYALGEWGRLEHLIYDNWDIVPSMPDESECDHIFYGIDFGHNVPSVLLRLLIKENHIWEEQLIYKEGLTNKDFADQVCQLVPSYLRNKAKIYCDSAEPDRIEEIKARGLMAVPAKKGQKSVKDSIDFVKRYKVHILESSADLIREKRSYKWKKDSNGTLLDEPVKYQDHGMDAERYAVWTHLGRGSGPKIFVIE